MADLEIKKELIDQSTKRRSRRIAGKPATATDTVTVTEDTDTNLTEDTDTNLTDKDTNLTDTDTNLTDMDPNQLMADMDNNTTVMVPQGMVLVRLEGKN